MATLSSPLFVIGAFALQLLAIPLALLNIRAQGFTFDQLTSDPVMVACQYLVARYDGLIQPTVYSQVGTLLNYIGAPIAGIVLATRRSWSLRAVLFIVAFAPSMISVLVYADKGTVFQTAAYVLGGTIVGRVASGNTALITRSTIVAGVAGLIVIVPVMMLAMLNRGGGDCGDPERTTAILSTLRSNAGPAVTETISEEEKAEVDARSAGMVFYLRSYAFSHMFGFSDWFDDYVFGTGSQEYRKEERPALGYWTFMAIGEKIDRAKEIPEGYYDEYFEEPGVLKSNIYTVWRGLIYDFTIPGALLFMAALGAVSSLAYRRMLQRASAPVSQAGYIALAGFIYSTYLLSIFTWDSVYVAAVAVLVILWITPKLSNLSAGD